MNELTRMTEDRDRWRNLAMYELGAVAVLIALIVLQYLFMFIGRGTL